MVARIGTISLGGYWHLLSSASAVHCLHLLNCCTLDLCQRQTTKGTEQPMPFTQPEGFVARELMMFEWGVSEDEARDTVLSGEGGAGLGILEHSLCSNFPFLSTPLLLFGGGCFYDCAPLNTHFLSWDFSPLLSACLPVSPPWTPVLLPYQERVAPRLAECFASFSSFSHKLFM